MGDGRNPCANCGRITPHMTRGLCSACYSYLQKHGVMRPPTPERLQFGAPKRRVEPVKWQYTGDRCANCGLWARKYTKGLCQACYAQYWRETRRSKTCANCGLETKDWIGELCANCYSYWRRTGKPRPVPGDEALPTGPKDGDSGVRVRYCLECGGRFVAKTATAKFCCRTHAYRYRDRERTKRREELGLCVKCGRRPATPSPNPELQRNPLAPPRYCDVCRAYWRERKQTRRA